MWGLRTIIPHTLQEQILSELHKAHPGVARMKTAARSHVWWLAIDNKVEETSRGCTQCFKCAKFRDIAIGDTVLACDHLSGQLWQPGTMVQHPSSHFCRVQLDNGRVWRRLMDDILQNNSHSKTLVYHPWRQQSQLFLTPSWLSHLKLTHIHLITQLNWRHLQPPQVLCGVDYPVLTDLLIRD